MTPTATYIAEENCLQEISNYGRPPDKPDIRFYSSSQEDMYHRHTELWESVMQAYNANKAKYEQTLRKIPCSPEPGFKGGEKYTEGVDYEIKGAGDWKWCYQIKGNIFAAPLVPVKSEYDRDENSLQGKAAIEFYRWMEMSSMSHPHIPLEIKYRMFADQKNAKALK